MSVGDRAEPMPGGQNSGGNSDLEATIDSAALPTGFPVQDLGSIGPYRLIRLLGEGGMGQVWLAEQSAPVKRQIALKIIKGGRYDNSALRRFDLERQTLAIMDHPVIAKVFDAGSTAEGQPYFVMEYVPGLPITQYCDQKRLSTRERLALFTKVCEGVQHAHQKAIIHRDLKPSNILVVEVDGKPIPRIIDFGIAKAVSEQSPDETLVTRAGGTLGTPGYMSPEQADPSVLDLDTRTDVYSLGVVLYQLLTGVLPFDAKLWQTQPFHEVLRKLQEEDPASPSTRISSDPSSASAAEKRSTDPRQLASLLRGDLDWITLKALEKDRARRYGTPLELASDINRYLQNEPVTARPASTAYRTRKYVQRHKFGVAAVTVMAVLLIAFAAMQTLELRRITRERDRADRVTGFMTGMFKVADPSEARGNDIRAREILDKASNDIDTGLHDDPDLQAQMMFVMGSVYKNLGLYSKAEALLRHSVETRKRALGARNPDTLQSIYDLSEVLTFEGRYPEAEKLCRETLDGRRIVLGPENRDTLTSMTWLGWILFNEGRYAEAEKLYRDAIEIATRKYGAEDKISLTARNRLAINLTGEGKNAEAEQAFREVLEIQRRTLGPDDKATLATMNNLANALQSNGKLAESEKINVEMLEASRRAFGPEHPRTLMCMSNLGNVLHDEKRNAEAEKMLRDVVEISRRTLGPEHRSTVIAMGNLANVLTDEGRYLEAEQLYRQTIDAKRQALGPEHPSTLLAEDDLGNLLKKEKRFPESEKLYRQALEGRMHVLGTGHPDTASSAYGLGCVLALEGKRDEAFTNLQFAEDHALGANTRKGLESDADLTSLHGDPRFDALVTASRQPAVGVQKAN